MDLLNGDDKFRYMMLSRLKSDFDYYLGYENRSSKSLFEIMKALQNIFDEIEKPEWLTWEEILDYEIRMNK